VVGTNVVVFTTGTAPMTFTLAFPPHSNVLVDRDLYDVSPAYQMTMGLYTVSILDPVDDLILTHSADFELSHVDGTPAAVRVGWTFRWLQGEEDFYDDTAGLVLSAERESKLKDKPTSDDVFPQSVSLPGYLCQLSV